jgi:hypothetical protein
MDTQRDREYLDELWKSGKAPWQVIKSEVFGFHRANQMIGAKKPAMKVLVASHRGLR